MSRRVRSARRRRARGRRASTRRRARRRCSGQLWGSGKGKFRTSGQYSSATVRGTIWLVQDRCEGTLTKVCRGTVQVADFQRNKTVSVTAGHSYLARADARRAREHGRSEASGDASPGSLRSRGRTRGCRTARGRRCAGERRDHADPRCADRHPAGRGPREVHARAAVRADLLHRLGRGHLASAHGQPGRDRGRRRRARSVPARRRGLHRDVDRRRDAGRRPRSAGDVPRLRRRRPRARQSAARTRLRAT